MSFLGSLFDNSSKSDNSQEDKSENQTQTVNVGNENAGTVATFSRVNGNINMLDGGAVSKSFEFAEKMGQNAFAASISATDNMRKASIDAVSAVKSAYNDQSNELAKAYETSKAGDQKMMAFAGLAVIGLVALKVFAK